MPAGDAAEQVVSMSMRGVEVAANVAGKTAINLATFLIAALKNREKTHGKASIKAFDGKPTKVFVMNKTDFQKFAKEAKAYGVVYAAIVGKNESDGLVDVVINARDAAKVNRIAERYSISTVETSIDNSWEENPPEEQAQQDNIQPDKTADKSEPQKPEIPSEKTKLEKQPTKTQKVKIEPELPTPARTRNSNPSAPISPSKSSDAEEYSERKPSVRAEIKKIRTERKEANEVKKQQQAKSPVHRQTAPRKRKTEKTK